MDDEVIINKIINKDDSGLDDLVNKYGNLIYGVIDKTLFYDYYKNDIEEIFNTVIFKLWSNLDCYDSSKGKLTNFIISVAKFTAIDYVRKEKDKANNADIDEIKQGVYEEKFEFIDRKKEFMDLIKDLKDIDKNIIIRRYYFCEEVKEIAQNLNVKPGYVSNRILRAKDKLRRLINK